MKIWIMANPQGLSTPLHGMEAESLVQVYGLEYSEQEKAELGATTPSKIIVTLLGYLACLVSVPFLLASLSSDAQPTNEYLHFALRS